MSRMLTTIQGRVLGCLLEKERTTPDQYPLTLNALVLACNQSTSRDPVMHLVDHEVETVLAGLKSETLLRYVHPSHGRSVTRYRQVADEAWALDPPAAALVAVLLLRGPQTVAELRTRTERMHAFESPEAVETVLRERMVVALPESHALAARKRLRLRDLNGQPMILYPNLPLPGLAQRVVGAFVREGVELHVEQEVEDVEDIVKEFREFLDEVSPQDF